MFRWRDLILVSGFRGRRCTSEHRLCHSCLAVRCRREMVAGEFPGLLELLVCVLYGLTTPIQRVTLEVILGV